MEVPSSNRNNNNNNLDSSDNVDEKPIGGWDLENNHGTPERKMSRITDPLPGIAPTEESSELGKQIEMESNNAIKYRTCSWPKVNP